MLLCALFSIESAIASPGIPSRATDAPSALPAADPAARPDRTPDPVAELFAPLAAAPHRRLPPAVPRPAGPAGPGEDLLDLYAYGDLAVAQDTTGAWFEEALAQVATGDLNWIIDSVADRFYQDYGDDYDYLCIFMLRDFGIFFAFYQPMANEVHGIGYDSIIRTEEFDLTRDSKIQGYIFMNYVGYWQDNPASGRYVFDQEFGHRWGSFINVDHPDLDEMELLGRDDAHWSFWYDTPNSPMEGNGWADNGDGTWTTTSTSGSTYSDLDLYLMGLIGPDDVGPQTVLQPSGAYEDLDPGTAPIYFACTESGIGCRDLTTDAAAVTFTVDDVVAAEGARRPDVEDSPKSFRMAMVVLALEGDDLSQAALDGVHDVRRTFEADWEEDVEGRADLDTSLGDTTAPSLYTYVEPEVPAAADGGELEGIYAGGCARGASSLAFFGVGIVPLVRRRARPARRG